MLLEPPQRGWRKKPKRSKKPATPKQPEKLEDPRKKHEKNLQPKNRRTQSETARLTSFLQKQRALLDMVKKCKIGCDDRYNKNLKSVDDWFHKRKSDRPKRVMSEETKVRLAAARQLRKQPGYAPPTKEEKQRAANLRAERRQKKIESGPLLKGMILV